MWFEPHRILSRRNRPIEEYLILPSPSTLLRSCIEAYLDRKHHHFKQSKYIFLANYGQSIQLPTQTTCSHRYARLTKLTIIRPILSTHVANITNIPITGDHASIQTTQAVTYSEHIHVQASSHTASNSLATYRTDSYKGSQVCL